MNTAITQGSPSNSSNNIVILQHSPFHSNQNQGTALGVRDAASIQRSWELASSSFNQIEIVRNKLNQHIVEIEKETQALVAFREERAQICKQLLEQAEQNLIAHENAKSATLDTIAQIDQQSANVLQTHIEIGNRRINEENEKIRLEKLKIDEQTKEIERLRKNLTNLY